MNNSFSWFMIGAILAWIGGGFFHSYLIEIRLQELGSKGHACFANHTCRENLKCLVADGIDATCVKP